MEEKKSRCESIVGSLLDERLDFWHFDMRAHTTLSLLNMEKLRKVDSLPAKMSELF